MKKYLFILLIAMLQYCSMPVYAESQSETKIPVIRRHKLADLFSDEIKKVVHSKQLRAIPNAFSIDLGCYLYTPTTAYEIEILIKGDVETQKLLKLMNNISKGICNAVNKSKINKPFTVYIYPVIVTKIKWGDTNIYNRKFTPHNGIKILFNGKVDGKKVKKISTILPAENFQSKIDLKYNYYHSYDRSLPFDEED